MWCNQPFFVEYIYILFWVYFWDPPKKRYLCVFLRSYMNSNRCAVSIISLWKEELLIRDVASTEVLLYSIQTIDLNLRELTSFNSCYRTVRKKRSWLPSFFIHADNNMKSTRRDCRRVAVKQSKSKRWNDVQKTEIEFRVLFNIQLMVVISTKVEVTLKFIVPNFSRLSFEESSDFSLMPFTSCRYLTVYKRQLKFRQ